MRTVLVVFLALVVAFWSAVAPAWPRRNCYRTNQTYGSYNGWSNGCTVSGCHAANYVHQAKAAAPAGVNSLLAGLAQKQGEWSTLLQGLDQLGFRPTGQATGYGMPAGSSNAYMSGGSYTHQQGGLNQLGSSIYARPQSEINTLAVLQMAERLAGQTGQIAGQGYASAADLGGQQLKIAEINAVRDAAVAALGAARPTSAPSFRQFQFTTSIDSRGNVQVTQPDQGGQPGSPTGPIGTFDTGQQPQGGQQAGDYGAWNVIQQAGCLACHNKDKADGGLDLSGYNALPGPQRGEIARQCFAAVTNGDPEKRMPRGKPALPPEQTAVFSLEWAANANSGQVAP